MDTIRQVRRMMRDLLKEVEIMGIHDLENAKPEPHEMDITPIPTAMSLQDKARDLIYQYITSKFDQSDTPIDFTFDDVYVVWFCKTLQNWKALLSSTLPDQMYYEVTYDGDKQRTYIDAYKKFNNVCIPD